ncbi:MAG: hypothetical protein II873_08725 [Oscillospiraceae bacterium]|nr:hypothetical protein [Oscillospiraceae bacterium]
MKTKRSFILSLLALVLILCAFIQPAWAYFTSSKQADGAVPISFIRRTTIKETVDELTKNVTIHNDETSTVYVWVRARAYAGVQFNLYVGGEGWTEDGGWWYYGAAVPPNGDTKPLSIRLEIPEEVEPTDVVNVGVIYESITAFYNADGSFKTPNHDSDWRAEYILDSGSSTPNP